MNNLERKLISMWFSEEKNRDFLEGMLFVLNNCKTDSDHSRYVELTKCLIKR